MGSFVVFYGAFGLWNTFGSMSIVGVEIKNK